MCEAGEMCEEFKMVSKIVLTIAASFLSGNRDVEVNELGELECFAAKLMYWELKNALEDILSRPPPE